jgi:hypothetical protein
MLEQSQNDYIIKFMIIISRLRKKSFDRSLKV